MISYNELRPGMVIEYQGGVYAVLESEFLRMQQRKPVMKTKLRDIFSGKVKELSFQPSDQLQEAQISRLEKRFIYENRGEYWFDDPSNPRDRFSLSTEQVGENARFLKQNMLITVLVYNDKIVSLELPIKVDLKVVEAPPAIKGDTASGGGKPVTLETGAKITAPFFVGEGDIVRVNTQTGEYAERVEKA